MPIIYDIEQIIPHIYYDTKMFTGCLLVYLFRIPRITCILGMNRPVIDQNQRLFFYDNLEKASKFNFISKHLKP